MDAIVEGVVARLSQVRSVVAIVLGGSRARGTATKDSDYDIGVYWEGSREPLDVAEIRRAAADLADPGTELTVTEVGEWGRWIVGGAWLTRNGMQVDFLYRDVAAVSKVVEDCSSGQLQVDYQPGHPHCFVSSIWMAELAYCKVLYDPRGVLLPLKTRVQTYPPGLRDATLARFGWESAFALGNARKAVSRGDRSYICGCFFRSLTCMAHALHALNGVYLMNEKGAVSAAAGLQITVPDLEARVDEMWVDLGKGDYAKGLGIAERLVEEFEQLTS